jgi:hypothetical protein
MKLFFPEEDLGEGSVPPVSVVERLRGKAIKRRKRYFAGREET